MEQILPLDIKAYMWDPGARRFNDRMSVTNSLSGFNQFFLLLLLFVFLFIIISVKVFIEYNF